MKEQLKGNNIAWPDFFQPRPGQENSTAEESEQIPSQILDVFYLRQTVGGPTELTVVVSCLGGSIDIVTGERISKLDSGIKSSLKDLQVNRRNQFRAITAEELYVGTLDAVLQETQMPGSNDTVYVFGTLFGKTEYSYGEIKKTLFNTEGRISVGRLDLLHALSQSANHSFQEPMKEDEQVYQILLPGGPLEQTQSGKSLVLLYPSLDLKKTRSLANDFIVTHIIYDLLTQLQKDMIAEEIKHIFATSPVPVYDRDRLEEELKQDGYEINGNVATKKPDQKQSNSSWLARLRSRMAALSAPTITIPEEASIEDYKRIIDGVLPVVTSVMDQKMLQVLASRVEVSVSAVAKPVKPRVESVKPVLPPVQPTFKAEPIKRPRPKQQAPSAWSQKPMPMQSRTQRNIPDWGADFQPVQVVRPVVDTTQWPELTGVVLSGKNLVSRTDWEQDFINKAKRTNKNAQSNLSSQLSTDKNWEVDFKPMQQSTTKKDYSDHSEIK